MIKNYLKVAVRNLLHNKSFSFINISGLTIGMASSMLILLWVQNELSHDRFHAKLDRLYQVWSNDNVNGSIKSMTNTPEVMAPSLKSDYPEVEEATRLRWTRNLLSIDQEKKLMSTGGVVDPGFLSMFSFPLLSGNTKTALNDPHSIILTKKLAEKLFNDEDVIGKTIVIGGKLNYKVSGVLKDLPNNTQFDFIEYLVSYRGEENNIDREWANFSVPTFVLLKPDASPESVSAKIKDIVARHTNGVQKTEEFLYPVSQLWLYSSFVNGKPVGGRINTVRTFSIIASFILLIACINFMNLSTAKSEKRAKEVGIRKVAGALKKSLVGQFLGESILLALIAGVISLLIVHISLPAFNQLTGKQLHIQYDNIHFWLSGIGFILLTGVLAGSYPAFFLSGFKPALVLKGGAKKINAPVTPRKVLVVLQFTLAIILIVCTIIVTRQIKYGEQRDTGYDRNGLVYIFLNDEMNKNFPLIKNDLLGSGAAVSAAKVQSPLTDNWSWGIGLNWQGKDPNLKVQINRYSSESDFVKTSGVQLLQGRDIDVKNYPADSTACLINESAARIMNFKNPLGQLIYDDPVNWHVVGVIRDFVQESPYEPVKPMIIKGPKEWRGTILVRLNSRNPVSKNIAGMEKVFKKYNPDYPFEYHFADEAYASKFDYERLTGKLAGLFAGLAIFISCLGLFGLAAFMAENRTKEIGIRKVLGASVASITTLLTKDFVLLVLVSVIIASPVAYWASNNWLQDFSYRITIDAWVFFIAGIIAIVIALLTVSYQAIRAAIGNPVKSLRSE